MPVDWELPDDIKIVDLPPHPRNSRDRLRPLFLKALQVRRANPHSKRHQNWTVVYDRAKDWAQSIPRDYCVEGAESMETIDNDVREKEKTLKKKAAELEVELGRFEVVRRSGAVYIKHVGRIPRGSAIE